MSSHSTSVYCGNGYWSQKVQPVGLPSLEDINFGDEIITLTAYKGKGRNIKPKRWPVQMTSRLKKELLQLQLQRRNKNDDALVFEQAKVNLRKLWTAAYTEAGLPTGTRLFYSVRHNFGTEMA